MKKVHTVSKQIALKSLSVAIAAALGTSQALAQEVIPTITEALNTDLTVLANISPGVCALKMDVTQVDFGEIIPKGTEHTIATQSMDFAVNCQAKRRIAFQITDNNTDVADPVGGGSDAYRFGDVKNMDDATVSVGHVNFALADVKSFYHYNSANDTEGVALKFNNVTTIAGAAAEFTDVGNSVFQKNEFLVPYETETISYQYQGSEVSVGSENRLASGTDYDGKLLVNLVVRPNSELDLKGESVNLEATYTFKFAYL